MTWYKFAVIGKALLSRFGQVLSILVSIDGGRNAKMSWKNRWESCRIVKAAVISDGADVFSGRTDQLRSMLKPSSFDISSRGLMESGFKESFEAG